MTHNSEYRICFVCTGNICRSPMAEVVMVALVARAGLTDQVLVDSAGTGDWHIGEHADRRALAALTGRGYDGSGHRARQFEPQWLRSHQLVVGLDRGHLRALRTWAPDESARARIRLLRSFDPALPTGADPDIADPYYDGPAAFDTVLDQIEAGCRGLLDRVRGDLQLRAVVGSGPDVALDLTRPASRPVPAPRRH